MLYNEFLCHGLKLVFEAANANITICYNYLGK